MSLVVILYRYLVAYYRRMVDKRARGAGPVLTEVRITTSTQPQGAPSQDIFDLQGATYRLQLLQNQCLAHEHVL